MITNHQQLPVLLSPHRPLEHGHPARHAHRLALDEDLVADHGGAEVGDVEVAGDAEQLPEAGAGQDVEGEGGEEVEEGCGAATWESELACVSVIRPCVLGSF